MASESLPLISFAVTTFKIYNPADHPIVKDYAGHTYTFAPGVNILTDDEDEAKMADPKRPGRRVLRPGYVFLQGVVWSAISFKRDPNGTTKVTVNDALKFFFGEDGRTGPLADAGLRPLFGDDRDETLIEEARKAFGERQYLNDLGLKNAHMSRVAKEQAAGQPATSPGKDILAAMGRIAAYERGLGAANRYKCWCGFGCPTPEDLQVHVDLLHEFDNIPEGFPKPKAKERETSQSDIALAEVESRPTVKPIKR